MDDLASDLSGLQEALAAAIARHRVPGASIGIMRGNDTLFATAGVLSARTGLAVTPDAVFQIGSITKTFTTTLIMQLVDEGRLDLDAPVRACLPELCLADAEAASTITLRQMLSHTSGIDGDFFHDTGRGDDCVERYVLACSALPQVHAPGAGFSYCNAAFAILGRVIERHTGMTWDAALRERLLTPIGARTMVTLPEDVLRLAAAVGHVPGKDGTLRVARLQLLPRSNGPAGATPFASTADLLAFARMHLQGGTGADGAQVLSRDGVAAMQQPQHTFDLVQDPAWWGLGWALFDWGGERLFGHDGNTVGQASFLRVLPSQGIAVALLANGGRAGALYRELFTRVFETLAGIAPPPLPMPVAGMEFDAARYTGRYERLSSRLDVTARDGGLDITSTPLHAVIAGMPPQTLHFKPVDERRFVAEPTEWTEPQVAAFGHFDADGRATEVTSGFRLNPRR